MQHLAMLLAGLIGETTAIIHGILTQKLMVAPVAQRLAHLGGGQLPVRATIRRLIPLLLQYSTYSWLLGGLALIAAANWAGYEARLWIGLLVGGMFLFGAVANCWGTRGRHPGWMLMAVAVVLIAADLILSRP